MSWYCYILRNTDNKDKNRTYNGFTNNPAKRIRQHNQEIKGGAKYTKKYGNKTWEIYVLVTGFPTSQNALQCEWRIKHPDNKRKRCGKYIGPKGRIKGLNEVLQLDKWTSQSTIDSTFNIDIWILKEYAHLLTNLKSNITLHVVDKIDIGTLNIVNTVDTVTITNHVSNPIIA